MATTIQNVIDRAKAMNPLNTSLVGDVTEMMSRIQQMQQRVFTALASLNAARFTVSATPASTNASSNRTVNLAALAQPLERLIRVALPTGVEVLPVTESDQNAQLAPRYFVRGTTMYEVGSDWGPTGAITLTVLYAYGAAAISLSGATTQTVSVPDEWCDVLILPLARYLHVKDPGRDPIEYQALTQQYGDAWSGFLHYATNYDGDLMRSQLLPQPPESATQPAQAA